jgi:ribonuclease HI
VALLIRPDEYPAIQKDLVRYKITTVKSITATGSNPPQTNPFIHQFSSKPSLMQNNVGTVPLFWKTALSSLCSEEIEPNEHTSVVIKKHPEINIHRLPLLEYKEEIDLYTDGSWDPLTNEMGSGIVIVDRVDNSTLRTAYTKPEKSNASSTKAEIFAILKGLEVIHKDSKIKCYSDSANALANIEKFRSNKLTHRQTMKIENNNIYKRVIHELKRFTYPVEFIKVKAHSGVEHNESADKAAAHSLTNLRFSSYFAPYKDEEATKADYQMYENQVPVDLYPLKLIKNKAKREHTSAFNERLDRHWLPIIPNGSIINHALTKKAASAAINRPYFLNTLKFEIEAFHLDIISSNLQTLDKRISYKNFEIKSDCCVMCNDVTKIETEFHLWECSFTIQNYETIRSRFKQFLAESIKFTTQRDKNIQAPDIELLIHILEINEPAFLSSTLSKGIITSRETSLFSRNIPPIKNFTKWLPIIVGSFIQALYDVVWRVRTRKIENTNNQLKKERKKEIDKQMKQDKKAFNKSIKELKRQRRNKLNRRFPAESSNEESSDKEKKKKKKEKEKEKPREAQHRKSVLNRFGYQN